MIRRRPFEDDEDNPERWLISYADFITLLFAFFVVMYGISSVNVGKYEELSSAMDSAFSKIKPAAAKIEDSEQRTIIKPLPLDYLLQQKYKREHEKMAEMGQDIANTLSPLIQDKQVQVMQSEHGVRVDISDRLIFDAGSSNLTTPAMTIIQRIANTLKQNKRLIQVEGHTDNTPIHTQQFYSNWELSAMRATTVLRLLNEAGIKAQRLSAIGYGATQPIASNDTAFGRGKNRRVSIMILYETKKITNQHEEIKPEVQFSPTVESMPTAMQNP